MNVEGVGHVLVESRGGHQFFRIRCPVCHIWLDGPSIIDENGVQIYNTWPCLSHEIAELTAEWKQRINSSSMVDLDRVHIHVQVVDLNIYPDWLEHHPRACVQYYDDGEIVHDPGKLGEGGFNGVLLWILPENLMTWRELEEILVHELVHIAFPNAGIKSEGKSETYSYPLSDRQYEIWSEEKTFGLLEEQGYITEEKPFDPDGPFI